MLVYISKSDTSIEVNFDAMPKAAQMHIIEYGLRQKLNDAGSQFTKKELGEEAGKLALGAAENVLEALMRGEVSVRVAAKALSLEEREAEKLLTSMYKDAFGKDEAKWNKIALANKHNTTVEKLEVAIMTTAAKRAVIRRKELAAKAEAKNIAIEL